MIDMPLGSFDARGATFSADAWFGRATFCQDARFSDATFSGDARFIDETFSRDAWFRDATFSRDARFVSRHAGAAVVRLSPMTAVVPRRVPTSRSQIFGMTSSLPPGPLDLRRDIRGG